MRNSPILGCVYGTFAELAPNLQAKGCKLCFSGIRLELYFSWNCKSRVSWLEAPNLLHMRGELKLQLILLSFLCGQKRLELELSLLSSETYLSCIFLRREESSIQFHSAEQTHNARGLIRPTKISTDLRSHFR